MSQQETRRPSAISPALAEYNFESKRRLRCGFIGAGGHSYRNVYPTFLYAPVDLVTVCDLDEERAEQYARLFGADHHCSDHRKLLNDQSIEAVFIVTSYNQDGRVQATQLALEALDAGKHVWMEKPTAATVAEIEDLRRAAERHHRFVMTGLKKTFTPAIERVKQIIDSPEFGGARSVSIRYPQALPPLELRSDLRRMRSFLDHIYHPGSVLNFLLGPIHRFTYEWEPQTEASVASIQFMNGAVGQMHLAAGHSGTSPLERLEVIGDGTNVVVDNGVTVTYYRRAPLPVYGRAISFLTEQEIAPLRWEPEFSLGQLNNKNLFYLGYVQEVIHFCDAVLSETPPTRGTLADSLEIMKLFTAYCETPPGVTAIVNDREGREKASGV